MVGSPKLAIIFDELAQEVDLVLGNPELWTTVDEAEPSQQTPDIATIIQEIRNQPGWSTGNSMVFIVTGSGEWVAESYNGDQAGASLLHVEYINEN